MCIAPLKRASLPLLLLTASLAHAQNYQQLDFPTATSTRLADIDRGKDIVASPDGFGFEHPRIVVEVKHRKGQMGSQEIRSFLGGRHKDDRGLYVSTGGVSKDADIASKDAEIASKDAEILR